MSHEITDEDGLVLAGVDAWHGLGIVVAEAPTPAEALKIANLGWTVEQEPLYRKTKQLALPSGIGVDGAMVAHPTDCYIPVCSSVANVRSDTRRVLGVVGDGFSVVQNTDLAALVYAAAGAEDVKIESAGSLRQGRDVFFCARLGSFKIGDRDETLTYALFANSHDGSKSLSVSPTTVRVCCKNTLRAALSGAEAARLTVNLRHSSGLAERLPDVRACLRGAAAFAKHEEDKARALADRSMTDLEAATFFAGVYAQQYGAVPKENADRAPLTAGEKAKRTRAVEMIGQWSATLQAEARQLDQPVSAWLAANAVTRWIDHRRTTRGGDEGGGDRMHSNLFGSADKAKNAVMALALDLASK